jgi:ureidoacrylate peracid hydrolase
MAPGHTRREATAALIGIASAAGISNSAIASVNGAGPKASRQVSIEARPEPVTIDLRKTAVLVIDMQNDFGAKGGMFDRAGIDIGGIRAVVPNVRAALATARKASLPIIYIKMGFKPDMSDAGPPTSPNFLKHATLHAGQAMTAPDGTPSRILIRDNWGTEIIPELRPEAGDTTLYKHRFSAFYRTGLDEMLKRRGIEALIVTGCTTSVCVESTVRDAMFRDYRCIVLEDCTAEPIGATAPRSNHEASLLTMEVLFAWISSSAKFSGALNA